MQARGALVLFCLFFSGLAALVYQVIWTRLLGFAFGTTTEAIGTVLAVFFAGMAIGNWIAARKLHRVERPIRVYSLLELGIGAFALGSLPVLRRLEHVYALLGSDYPPFAASLLRLVAAAMVLLPPTIAMGATLPIVARGSTAADASLGRSSALLYAANTLGAVAGAYLCGFWMIPSLGLGRSVCAAAAINLVVSGIVLWGAGSIRVGPAGSRTSCGEEQRDRVWFLAIFGVSGFVAIGYEMVWSRVFSLVMEGTLYGFSTVLAAYLLGIAVGSAAIAGRVDRIRDLPRWFGGLHLAIAGSVAIGISFVPLLPHFFYRLVDWTGSRDVVHLFFLLVLPIVFVPTALFGAAFPVLIRLYTREASAVGEGVGIAVAVNTAGSIAASLLLAFWWLPVLGLDATLYALLLIDLIAAFAVLIRAQGPARIRSVASAAAVLALIALSYNGVRIEQALAGRWIIVPTLDQYRSRLAEIVAKTREVVEGREAIVSVHDESWGRRIRTNGMPEAGRMFTTPHATIETFLVGLLPYLLASDPERGLVIGFGSGSTVDALVQTGLRKIEVVELEEDVVAAARDLYPNDGWPLDDPRVQLIINDGRHHLVLGRHGDRRYDVITSQPSHPWLAGAANLFTEDFFALARDNLTPGGVFALWLNGVRIDPDSMLAVLTSFERVFPGSVLLAADKAAEPRRSLVLLGSPAPLDWDMSRITARIGEPNIARALGQYEIGSLEELLARFEGPLADFASIDPNAANTDDNARVETRIPHLYGWTSLDFSQIEARLPEGSRVLPEIRGAFDAAGVLEGVFELGQEGRQWEFAPKVRRLVAQLPHLQAFERSLALARADLRDPSREADGRAALRRLAADHPTRPEPLRALGLFLALHDKHFAEAAAVFAEAHRRSGAARDAYDTARSWHPVQREMAWQWAARIPEAERAQFPRLALYGAEQALAARAPVARLHDQFEALLRYRDTPEGRSFAGVDATLGALALAIGDRETARAYLDSDAHARASEASVSLDLARQALDAGDLQAAGQALGRASELSPSDLPVLRARAQLAQRRGDPLALEQTLAAIRRWAPSSQEGELVSEQVRLDGNAAHEAARSAAHR